MHIFIPENSGTYIINQIQLRSCMKVLKKENAESAKKEKNNKTKKQQ